MNTRAVLPLGMALKTVLASVCLPLLLLLQACGGGGGGAASTVSGSVTGLEGTGLALLNNGVPAQVLARGATGFSLSLAATETAYNITLQNQPVAPLQSCTVLNGQGTLGQGGAPVSVQCRSVSDLAVVAYAPSRQLQLLAIHPQSGALSPVGNTPLTLADGALPVALASTPDGRFLFVVDKFDAQHAGAVWSFSIDAGTGQLAPTVQAKAATGVRPLAMAIDPAGRFAYVSAAEGLHAYRIDAATGALTPLAGSPFASGQEPGQLAIAPSGRLAYANAPVDNTIWGYALDPLTGALDTLPGSPFAAGPQPGALAIHPSGRYAYSVNASLFSKSVSMFAIAPDSGQLKPLIGSPVAIPGTDQGQPAFVTADPVGRWVWAWGWSSLTAFSVDSATGRLSGSPVGPEHGLPGQVAVDTLGQWLLVAQACCVFGMGVTANSIDPVAGSLTTVAGGRSAGLAGPSAMVVVRLNRP